MYWSELHPEDNGRRVIYSYGNGHAENVRWTPEGFDCASEVHGYGGGAFIVYNNTVYFVNRGDQRIYMQKSPLDPPAPITPADFGSSYADADFCVGCSRLVCIKECHKVTHNGKQNEPQNIIVLIDVKTMDQKVLVS